MIQATKPLHVQGPGDIRPVLSPDALASAFIFRQKESLVTNTTYQAEESHWAHPPQIVWSVAPP